MTETERYELLLYQAKNAEVAHNLAGAIKCLNLARKHTKDSQELQHLDLWAERLKRKENDQQNSDIKS
jgi:hypothetical protein